MDGEVIKSFLVGLGFGVDEASLAKFNKAIVSASVKVAALYAGIQAASAGIFYSISKISEGFEEVGYSLRLVAPAINKMLLLRAVMLDAYRRAGIDLTKVVRQAILFNFALAKTKFAIEAVYKSVAARFFPLLTKQLDIFRLKIFANMPKIKAALDGFVKYLFRAFEATIIFGTRVWSILERVWDFFKRLDEATGGWSTKILGFIAVWKLLNLEFLATPLGAIIAGIVALIALYDDFKVWQEGGKSFFNWTAAVPIINAVSDAIEGLIATWQGFVDVVLDAVLAVRQLFSGDTAGFIASLKDAGNSLISIFSRLWEVLKDVAGGLDVIGQGIASKIVGLFGGSAALGALTGPAQSSPLLPSSSSSNTKIHQENNTNIYGVPDANGVAASQTDVNQQNSANLTRSFSSKNGLAHAQ
jgi:hypothetical protein